MAEWFFTCFRISLLASVMIVAVLLARPLLQKAPRSITCLLWLLVALRLLIPFELESPLSLQPRPVAEPAQITEVAPQQIPVQSQQPPITEVQPQPQKPVAEVLPEAQPPAMNTKPEPPVSVSEAQYQTSRKIEPGTVLAIIWMAGGTCLLFYAAVSLIILRHRVRDAVRCPDNVWESDRIADAFLLGYWRPRIYLPIGLTPMDRALIVCHERAHQSRKDQWWKLLGLICLSVHWFNPLVWVSFWLMCRDIEAACDEKVIGKLDLSQRKNYSMALLNSGKRLSGLLSYPVAFGEMNIKSRIKSVLRYRKPGLWVTLGAVTAAAVIAVCFMTNPINQKECVHEFGSAITAEATCLENGVRTDTCQRCKYTVSVPVPATGHRYDHGAVTLEASCTAEGTLTYHCIICNHTLTEPIPMVAHVLDAGVETQASTCSEKGVLTHTCNVCGTAQAAEIDTLEHTFGEKTITKSATCASEGEICVFCTVCGHQELVEKTPKTDDHHYENNVIRNPTCIDHGKGENVCTLCGHSMDCNYDLTDHRYGHAVVVKEATCTAKGECTYTCSVCNYIKTEAVARKDHIWSEADCDTRPVCAVCGTKGSIQGHNYVMKNTFPAYPTHLGTKTYNCTLCGNTKTTYFGGKGTYDMSALQKAGIEYAKKLGFITDPCPGHGSYSKITREPYYSVVSLNGGQEMLGDMLISMIDEMDRRCEDNTQYYAEVVVKYIDSHATKEGAYFRLEVYYHLCVQEE